MIRNLDFLKKNLIAHRGLHNIDRGIPENSLSAFKMAVKKNYIIEMDVHILTDGEVVVFHDDNLFRMTGINKLIKNTTYNELKDLKLKNTKEHIPLLKDVLNLIDGKVPVIIELKYDNKVGLLEDKVIKLLKNYKGKYAIKSFSPLSIYYFRRKSPETIRGQLVTDFKHEKRGILWRLTLGKMIFNPITKPDFISCDIRSLPNKRIKRIRKKVLVLGWTIKNKADLAKSKEYCDNYICENIDDYM